MAQLIDLLIVVLLLLAVARQFPQIAARLGQVFRHTDTEHHAADALNGVRTIDLLLCKQCGTASPLSARFCDRCGSRLPRYSN
jgi:ribosomal protein L40E